MGMNGFEKKFTIDTVKQEFKIKIGNRRLGLKNKNSGMRK